MRKPCDDAMSAKCLARSAKRIFDQLRLKCGQDAMAKYFQTKRRMLQPGRSGYPLDDCVAVWSNAVGEDLFPWFSSIGISVNRTWTDLPMPGP